MCSPVILMYGNQTITAERSLMLRVFLSSPISGPIPLIYQSTLCAHHSQSENNLQLCARRCYQSDPCGCAGKAGCWAVSLSVWILSLSQKHTALLIFSLFFSSLKSGGTNCPSVSPFPAPMAADRLWHHFVTSFIGWKRQIKHNMSPLTIKLHVIIILS